MVKCVSECKLFSKSECTQKEHCAYTNGNKMKYCRLSHDYIMNPPRCNITRRLKKKDVDHKPSVNIPVNKSVNIPANKSVKKSVNIPAKKSVKKSVNKRVNSPDFFLNIICPNTGMCIAFGNNSDLLTQYFNGFTDFSYALSPITQIAKGENGFIYEILYNKDGYAASSILKSSQKPSSDNLLYEYVVGTKYVNQITKIFPCFVETYGLYYYDKPASWRLFSNKTTCPVSNLRHLILQNNVNYAKGCTESNYAACLIQHVPNAISLKDACRSPLFTTHDLVYMLFIVYHALSTISTAYTHYDLHYGNVLIYTLPSKSCIEYNYHYLDGTTRTFLSAYLPKIIDYGRSYFNNGTEYSRQFYNTLCNTRECDPNCGVRVGFSWLDPVESYGISSIKKNESHDLRLLSQLGRMLHSTSLPGFAFNELQDILLMYTIYGVGLKPGEKPIYGTTENLTPTTFNIGTKTPIYNVTGAYTALKYIIDNPATINQNQYRYAVLQKIGNLHIYEDGRPMNYDKII